MAHHDSLDAHKLYCWARESRADRDYTVHLGDKIHPLEAYTSQRLRFLQALRTCATIVNWLLYIKLDRATALTEYLVFAYEALKHIARILVASNYDWFDVLLLLTLHTYSS